MCKAAHEIIPQWRPKARWQPRARWTVDGNIWTSAGVPFWLDTMFAFDQARPRRYMARYISSWMAYKKHQSSLMTLSALSSEGLTAVPSKVSLQSSMWLTVRLTGLFASCPFVSAWRSYIHRYIVPSDLNHDNNKAGHVTAPPMWSLS